MEEIIQLKRERNEWIEEKKFLKTKLVAQEKKLSRFHQYFDDTPSEELVDINAKKHSPKFTGEKEKKTISNLLEEVENAHQEVTLKRFCMKFGRSIPSRIKYKSIKTA
jgi:hypothetical protein